VFYRYPEDLKEKELAPGMVLRLVWGENVMLSYATIGPNLNPPHHTHPHEQAGIVVEGEALLTIGGETRLCKKGDAFVVPSNVPHGASTGDKGVVVVETFHPRREDYIAAFE